MSKPPVMTEKKKRSRNGCERCKKLKIKCDELKPSCEYCSYSNSECVYILPKKISRPRKKHTASSTDLSLQRVDHGIISSLQCLDFDIPNVLTYKSNKFVHTILNFGHSNINFGHSNKNLGQNGTDSSASLTKITDCADLPESKLKQSLQIQITSDCNPFEVKLLKFMHIFSPLLVPPIPGRLLDFMLTEIPELFSNSKIVRLAIYSFSCIHVWNTFHLENPSFADFATPHNMFTSGMSHRRIYDYTLTKGSDKNLYENTVNYFLDLVSNTNSLILGHMNQEVIKDEIAAKELLFSCFVIFMFLGMHSHNIIPLVKIKLEDDDCPQGFDQLLNLNSDLLTVGSTIKRVSLVGIKSVSQMSNELEFFKTLATSLLTFPMIGHITKNLETHYSQKGDNFQTDINYIVLKAHLEFFQETFSTSFLANRGLPFFKFYVVIDDEFRDLVRAKNPIALQTLFVYSFICLHIKYCVFTDKNVWIDFMNWYKEWNFHQFGGWKYDMDKNLYNLELDDTKDVRYYLELDPLFIS